MPLCVRLGPGKLKSDYMLNNIYGKCTVIWRMQKHGFVNSGLGRRRGRQGASENSVSKCATKKQWEDRWTKWESLEHPVPSWMSSSAFPQNSGPCEEKEVERLQEPEMMVAPGKQVLQTHQDWHTHELIEKWQNAQGLHTSKPDGISAPKVGNEHEPPSLTGSYFQQTTACKGKTSFLKWNLTGFTSHS